MSLKISVLIPVYNTAAYLEKCLDSILMQTYPNIEVIAIDDGSTDNSPQILEQYAAQYNNLKIIHQQNSGHQSARNKGIDNATGDYIAFVDSDDCLSSSDVISILTSVIDGNIDIVVGRININDGRKLKLFPSEVFSRISAYKYMTSYLLCGKAGWNLCAKLFKTSLIRQVHSSPIKVTAGEDALYTISLANSSDGDVVLVDKPVYNYYVRPGSITQTRNRKYIYDNFIVADYIENLLKDRVESKYLVAFRLLCMSTSFRYGWLGLKHPLNADAIVKYRTTKDVMKLYTLKKRAQIWMLINFADLLSKFIFKNRIDEK